MNLRDSLLVASTGASQLAVVGELAGECVSCGHITILHFEEYVGLEERHPASFRRCLRNRLVDKIDPGQYVLSDIEADVSVVPRRLNEPVSKLHVHAALIGIGENALTAFNNPPTGSSNKPAFTLVTLDDFCRRQEARGGRLASPEEVTSRARTMTVGQVLRSDLIVSCVPYKVKAEAVAATLEQRMREDVPATALRSPANARMPLEPESPSKLSPGPSGDSTMVGVTPERRAAKD